MATVAYPHIEISADGVPHITGTRTKVIEIVLDRLPIIGMQMKSGVNIPT
jgi:hypothetical protein